MAMARSEDFKTPTCRISFSQGLFEARAVNNGPKKYGCTLIYPNSARGALEKYVREVIVAEWGDKGLQRAAAGAIHSPFLSGTGKEARNKQTGELHPGMGDTIFFIRPQAGEDRPPVIRYRDENVPATKDEIYSGCHGFAVLNAYAWKHPSSGDGVSFGLRMFQRTGGGEHLAAAPIDVAKYYEPIPDEEIPDTAKTGKGAEGLFG